MLSYINTGATAGTVQADPGADNRTSITSNDETSRLDSSLLDPSRLGPSRLDLNRDDPLTLGHVTTPDSMKKNTIQPLFAKNMAQIMGLAVASGMPRMEPVDVIISHNSSNPTDLEKTVLDMPRVNSPLFKDFSAKKKKLTSKSSSSSGASFCSDNSSVDDSEADEDGRGCSIQELDSAQDTLQARTHIKLTFSNVGKPSARVVASAHGQVTESSSPSTDNVQLNNLETLKFEQDSHDCSKNADHSTGNTGHDDLKQDFDTEKGVEQLEKITLNQRSWTHCNSNVGITEKENYEETVLNVANSNTDSSNNNIYTVKLADVSITKLDTSGPFNPKSAVRSTKELLDVLKYDDVQEMRDIVEGYNKSTFTGSETVRTLLPVREKQSLDTNVIQKSDVFSVTDFSQTKQLMDGNLSGSHLTKSPTHQKFNEDVIPKSLEFNQTSVYGYQSPKETRKCDNRNTLKPSTKPVSLTGNKIDENEDSKESTENKTYTTTTRSVQKKGADNDKTEQDSSSAGVMSRKEIFESNDAISELGEERTWQLSPHSTSSASLSDILCHKNSGEATVGGPRCKDMTVSSQSQPRNSATKLVTAITTTTTNSGSIMSPVSKHGIKLHCLTNGIPDQDNPFITWTKLDDHKLDDHSLMNSVTSSSLAQALARSPYSGLCLPGEPPVPHMLPMSGMTVPQLSPLGVAVPQLSPMGLAGLVPGALSGSRMSPGSQMPVLSSPATSHRLRLSPIQGSTVTHQLSATMNHPGQSRQNTMSGEDNKVAGSQKSVKRTSRLSNIIESLRTSKEKEAAVSTQVRDLGHDIPLGPGGRSPKLELPSLTGRKSLSSSSSSSSLSSSPVVSADSRPIGDKLYHDNHLFIPHVGAESSQMVRASLDTSRILSLDSTFNALKDDLDKGRRMLEKLEMFKNGPAETYSKASFVEAKPKLTESNSSHNRTKSSSSVMSLFTSTAATTSPSTSAMSSSRLLSHQATKPGNQTYPSSSLASTRSSSGTNMQGLNGGNVSSLTNPFYHLAPSAGLAAAHMELNAAAANILTFQHLYGMPDPYLLKALMSNPVYLQRMMELQKQALDPLTLRQLEMYETAAALEKVQSSQEQQAALNAQSILWQAHAASLLQHQHMQQVQQYHLHHQQQQHLQQQQQQAVAAARERETRDTIAAILAGKTNNSSSLSSKPTGSISTGQSAKSLKSSLSANSCSSTPTSKRPHSLSSTSPVDIYSREVPSVEKKLRPSLPTSGHPHVSSGLFVNTESQSLFRPSLEPSKSSSVASSNVRPHTNSSSADNAKLRPELFDFSALQLSAAMNPHLWGYPTMLQQAPVDVSHVARFFEPPPETSVSSLSARSAGAESICSPEVLDLSFKEKSDKM